MFIYLFLIFLDLVYFTVSVFARLCVCVHYMYASRGQKKALDSLELDLGVAVSQCASWELNLVPLHE